jgi:hypothetical protein
MIYELGTRVQATNSRTGQVITGQVTQNSNAGYDGPGSGWYVIKDDQGQEHEALASITSLAADHEPALGCCVEHFNSSPGNPQPL